MKVVAPKPINDEQLEELRELLQQLRTEVQDSLVASREDSRPVGLDLSIGRLTRGDAIQQQQMASARRRRLETQLAQIEQALRKIADGSYGDCARCEEPIGYARLRARPEAPFCLSCQGGSER